MKDLLELFNEGPVAVLRWRNETGWPLASATDNVAELTGYSKEELLSGAVVYRDIIHPEDRVRVLAEAARSGNAGLPKFSHEPYRIVTPKGDVRWVRDQKLVSRDEKGVIECIIGYVVDITAEKRLRDDNRDILQKCEALLDGRESPVNIITPDYRVVSANRALLCKLKTTADAVTGRLCYEVYQRRSEPCELCAPRIVMETRTIADVEKTLPGPHGELFHFCTTAYPVFDENGNIAQVIEITTDVTERRRAEEKLREIAEEQSILLDALPAMIFWIDRDGRFVRVNERFARALKSHPDAIQGKSLFDLYPEGMASKFHNDNVNVLLSGVPKINIVEEVATPDGTIWLRTDKLPIADPNGNVRGIIGLSMDITDQKRAEEALKESGEQYRALFEDNVSVMILIDPERGVIVDANRAASSYYGYPLAEMRGMRMSRLNTCSEQQISENMSKAVSGERISFKFQHRLADGTIRDVEVYSGRIERFGKSLLYSIIHDVTDRIKAERQVLEERERLRATIRSIGDGVITTDQSGRVELMNGIAEMLTGWSQDEAAGRPLADVFCLWDKQRRERLVIPLEEALREKRIVGIADSAVLISRKGIEYRVADSAAPIMSQGELRGGVVVFRDVTEKLKTEEELQKASKLESVGLLAGGIAHDFNNILTGIFGNIELAKINIPPDHKAFRYIENANRSLERATHLSRQLLIFAKGGEPVLEDVDIADALRGIVSFNLTGSNVRAEIVLPDNLWPLRADKGQIGQVFSNLIINARQAMPTGGTIFICGENIRDMKNVMLPHLSSDFVMISVRDEGVGIPEHLLDRIFDPYFTTKKTGSGLGLATVHSIIQKHKGHAAVESRPGEGTTFRILLPAVNVPSPAVNCSTPTASLPCPVLSTGRVLIMDDEEMVQGVVGAMLEELGYVTESVYNGEEALLKYREALTSGKTFAFVLLDLTIPGGMGGKETAQKLLELDPEARMIVYSGYSDNPVVARFGEYGFYNRLMKPFTIDALRRALQGRD